MIYKSLIIFFSKETGVEGVETAGDDEQEEGGEEKREAPEVAQQRERQPRLPRGGLPCHERVDSVHQAEKRQQAMGQRRQVHLPAHQGCHKGLQLAAADPHLHRVGLSAVDRRAVTESIEIIR